jgi:hypothetical protein
LRNIFASGQTYENIERKTRDSLANSDFPKSNPPVANESPGNRPKFEGFKAG